MVALSPRLLLLPRLMISKLPSWIWPGAWLLALMAGLVNVVGILSFQHQPVTHLTGTTSLLADSLTRGDWPATLHLVLLITSFMLGTMISGFLVQDAVLRLGWSYAVALVLEALLLFAAMLLLRREHVSGLYSAACACGLQNAVISTFSGAVVRTTHVSGMFTDLGIYLGHTLRGMPVDRRRIRLCFVVISGFLAGGALGALAFRGWQYGALWIPCALALMIAGGISISRGGGTEKATRGR